MVMVILEVKMMAMRVLELPWTRIPFYEQGGSGSKAWYPAEHKNSWQMDVLPPQMWYQLES